MHTTESLLNSRELTEHLVDQLGRRRRILVVIDRTEDTDAWRKQLEDRVFTSWQPSRVIRRSTGFHTIELIGNSTVDVVSVRSIHGGAGRAHTYDVAAVPVDADERVLEVVVPAIAASVHGRLVRHSVGVRT
jgi:hypothetical protein